MNTQPTEKIITGSRTILIYDNTPYTASEYIKSVAQSIYKIIKPREPLHAAINQSLDRGRSDMNDTSWQRDAALKGDTDSTKETRLRRDDPLPWIERDGAVIKRYIHEGKVYEVGGKCLS